MPIEEAFPLALVFVLANRITRSYHGGVEAQLGLTLPEWRVLLSIARTPGISAAGITAYWAMEKMAVNRAILRLSRDGRIVRSRNPDDARSYRLELTPAGRTLYEAALPVANKRYQDLMSTLPATERRAWIAAMKKLISRAEKMT